MKTRIIIIVSILLNFSVTFAESSHFSDITPTNNWIHFAGKLSINNHDPVNGSDEIAVFVNDGNGGELMIGKAIVGSTGNNYYFISIYGDDAQTTQKDGALPGDTLIFKVWSSQDNIEQTISQNQLTIESANGLTQPDLPPVYQATHLEQYGYLHLAFQTNLSEPESKHSIPTNTELGIICFMSILVGISIFTMRKHPNSCS